MVKKITVSQKLEILKHIDLGNSERQIAKKFSIAPSTVNKIKQDKPTILQMIEDSLPLDRCRKIRKTYNEDINNLVWNWYKKMQQSCVPISGQNIKTAAKVFADKIGNANFKASNGWLCSFKNRYGISFNAHHKESFSPKLITEVLNSCKIDNVVDEWFVLSENEIESPEPLMEIRENLVSSYSDALNSIDMVYKFLLSDDPDLCVITKELYKEISIRALERKRDEIS